MIQPQYVASFALDYGVHGQARGTFDERSQRLIDGDELTKLMVQYNLGVQVRETFYLKQIDEAIFEE
jgi:restriction endonuclease Mrr